ncbi:hypothetical protein MMC13_000616 [Lambiella insularis]|nr:hypothetical protein [Lambiella insularis]
MPTNDLNGLPFQLKFVRAAQMIMFASVICEPPLGQTTVISHDQANCSHLCIFKAEFTVLIESSISFPEQGWEAVLWHNCHKNGNWDALPLHEVNQASEGVPLAITSKGRPKVYRRYFTGVITRPSNSSAAVEFTLKFRTSASASWKWVNDQSNLTNGELLFQAIHLPRVLSDCFGEFSSSISVDSIKSEVPDTNLWSLMSSIHAAGNKSVFVSESLGVPIDVTRWFALVRIWSPWLAPRHGKDKFKVHEDALLCSFLRRDGLHLVLLAMSGIEDVLTVFKGDNDGHVLMSSRNDGTESRRVRIIAAVGRTFETANAACMYQARKLVSGPGSLSQGLQEAIDAPVDEEARTRWMDNWYDGLTYCTWNGLGQDLNEQKIYHALDTLDKNDIKITNLIIDDNWQSLDNPGKGQFERRWTDFEANKEGFPNGLAYTITNIRDNHPSIEHVAVWHAILGYWGGVSPDGSIAKKYKTKIVSRSQGHETFMPPANITVVDADEAQRMYNDFYAFLLSCRVDSVKTDAQFFLDLLENAEDRRRFIGAYQDAWTISSLRYFSVKAISCMSQTPQILFHTQLPTNKPRLMVRNSDDFFPEIPTSHPWHIFMNAYNSLFTQHLNILPDWDMFQTSHEYSSFHAAGRCVSGGPIYFTDEPGKHDVNLIHQMSGQSIQGKTVILRPSNVGKTIASGVYTAYEEERLLKVGTYHGSKGVGSGILGIFNVCQKPLSEFIMLREFLGLEDGTEYLVRAHTTGEISRPMALHDRVPLVSLELQTKHWEILSMFPIHNVPQHHPDIPKDVKVAVIGLLGKMTGAAAIVESKVLVETNGRLHISTTLKALGILGLYISTLQTHSIEDDFLAMILGKAVPLHTVSKSASSDYLLEIDVERAWKEMKLYSAWNNEVTVEVFMSW